MIYDFTLPDTDFSSNDQFEDNREELNTSSFLPSKNNQQRQKYQSLLWKHYLLLNWMLEMNLSMNLTLPTMAFPTFFPDWLGDPTDNATACDILQSNSYAQKLKHLVRFS